MAHRASFTVPHTPEASQYRRPGDVSISVSAGEHTAASWARGSWRTAAAAGDPFAAAWGGRKGGRGKAVALGCVVLLGWLGLVQLRDGAHNAPIPCDPFERPGRLLVNLSPLDTHWRPLDDTACPPLPAYLPALHELVLGDTPSTSQHHHPLNPKQLQLVAADPLPPLAASSPPVDALSFLRSSRSRPPTVLLLGDSTDDDALDHFCRLFDHHSAISFSPRGGSDPRLDDFLVASEGGEETSRARGELRSCELLRADGRRTAVRVLGARFDASRVGELPLAALEAMGGAETVDVVVVHSGTMSQQLERGTADLRRSLKAIRQRFPNARIVVRLSHRPQDEGKSTNLNLAVQQLRHLQREVAQSEGVPVFDFGRLVEGYQFLQDGEHLSLNPGGVVYAQAVVHQLRLALERRTSWRRGWLWNS
ncbi:hypothetical protein JCM3775_003238 [Rhodotorula graminis]